MTVKPSGRVFVLGDNDLAGLAIVRSLGRSGLDVHLAVTQSKSITRHSRYVRRIHDLGNPLLDRQQFVGGVLEVVKDEQFDLVIPTSDKTLVPLLSSRAEIGAHTRLAVPDEMGYDIAFQKNKTMDLARELGIPVPETQLLSVAGDIDQLEGCERFPMVLKPQFSTALGTMRRNEVRIVESNEELRQRLPEMLARSPVLVQSFCPGIGVGLSVLADHGELVAAFQHERVHEPPRGGAGSYRKSVPLRDDLFNAAAKMCASMKWTGPAMFEFKVDSTTGSAVLMEINGRFWGSLALAIGAGVDFPRLLYDLLVLGKKTSMFTYKTPYYMRHTLRDVSWFWGNYRTPSGRPELLKVPWTKVAGELGHIVTFREGYDVESITDPVPALYGWSGLYGEIASFAWRKIEDRFQVRSAKRLAARTRRSDSQITNTLKQAQSVLFICFGNINRSAVAEVHLKSQLSSVGRSIRVESAGFYPEEDRSTSFVSLDVARELGIDLSAHSSRAVTPELLDKFDAVIAMDHTHLKSLREINPNVLQRTLLLSAFDDVDDETDILDPHGKSRETFHKTYVRILRCVDGLSNVMAYAKSPTVSENQARIANASQTEQTQD